MFRLDKQAVFAKYWPIFVHVYCSHDIANDASLSSAVVGKLLCTYKQLSLLCVKHLSVLWPILKKLNKCQCECYK